MGLDLSKIKKAYIIGIKGSGVIAVAELLQKMGVEVTGSDTREKFFTDEILKRLDIQYFEGFSPKNIPADIDLVIYSTAYREDNNEEFKFCREKNILMMSYPEVLAQLFNEKYGIAVCGTHGKTTTSALLAYILKFCGTDPSVALGSKILEWGSNGLAGQGEFFVIEADEFQNKLKLYNPKAVVLTSCDWDHPDCYPTPEDYKKAFADFVAKIPKAGFLVVWGDSVATNEIACAAKCEIIKYGFAEDNDVVIKNYQLQNFNVTYNDKDLGNFALKLVGKHNALNASAVIAVCHKFNLDMEKVREALKNFQGTSRRFEIIGERNGAILIDDYGHHPEEIKSTLKAAREIYPEKNIIAVFHPHSYSRTEALLQDFAQSFDDADKIIVLDIYGSARENSGRVSSKNIVDLINKYTPGKAEYIPAIPEVINYLKEKINGNDIVLAIGAGNVNEVVEKLALGNSVSK
ncbi:MAG: UDP-N-acetylmuramate--L-alanine ligase [Candidatus Moranbacteria bacterium]|nr:UDP-N-acetylmuramate--L-alanine ligase [Candidatus Moranbacteria bacterium]